MAATTLSKTVLPMGRKNSLPKIEKRKSPGRRPIPNLPKKGGNLLINNNARPITNNQRVIKAP